MLTPHVQKSDPEVLPGPGPLLAMQRAHDLLDLDDAGPGFLHHKVLRDVRPVCPRDAAAAAAILDEVEPRLGCRVILALRLALELGYGVLRRGGPRVECRLQVERAGTGEQRGEHVFV